MIRAGFSDAVMPIDTKSSLLPEVVIESTDAGCAGNFVFTHQRRGRNLRHHESGIQSGTRRKKGW